MAQDEYLMQRITELCGAHDNNMNNICPVSEFTTAPRLTSGLVSLVLFWLSCGRAHSFVQSAFVLVTPEMQKKEVKVAKSCSICLSQLFNYLSTHLRVKCYGKCYVMEVWYGKHFLYPAKDIWNMLYAYHNRCVLQKVFKCLKSWNSLCVMPILLHFWKLSAGHSSYLHAIH